MQEALLRFLADFGIKLSDDALLVIVSCVAMILGFLIARLLNIRQLRLRTQQSDQQQIADQAAFDDQLDQLSHTFDSLSQQALRHNNESFLTLARESFARLQSNANNDLSAREQSFANLVTPIQQSIKETDHQLKKLDVDRKITEAKLGEQINNLLASQHSLQSETRNLVTALRRPEVRGQWGELTLKRLVELAGMSEHCDFLEQITVNSDGGQIRPDMLIRLPSERELVVDVKTPLDAYLSAIEANDDELRNGFLQQHSRNLKQRVTELARKQYWAQFSRSPDFIILFVPGDQFLSAALDQDKHLLEYALEKRILLATPTSLVGLLRAIAYGWSQDTLSKNSEEIKNIGESLYQRLVTLTEHLNKLGRTIDQSVDQYNKVVGSFESNALPAARKLSTIGLGNDQPLEVHTADDSGSRRAKST
ncbi:MAG: DNA recombination protein RmuC [Gammaproteobacteria bacterium]|nr:DNA recombination protein RmuC [Gammaproteobacteria bacterium]